MKNKTEKVTIERERFNWELWFSFLGLIVAGAFFSVGGANIEATNWYLEIAQVLTVGIGIISMFMGIIGLVIILVDEEGSKTVKEEVTIKR